MAAVIYKAAACLVKRVPSLTTRPNPKSPTQSPSALCTSALCSCRLPVPAMARAPSSWTPSLALVLLVVAAAAAASSEAARVPAAVGNWTGEELRGAAARRGGRHGWRSRRRAFENGLGRTPQMGYVRTRRRRLQRCCYTFLRRRRPRAAPLPP